MKRAGSFVDYYRILEVDQQASTQEIRRSFRRLVLKAHPDKNPERTEWSERRIRELIQAYEVISNAEKRRRFDAEYRVRARTRPRAPKESVPFFFTKSDPRAMALRILYYLLHGRGADAVPLLDRLEAKYGPAFLREALDSRDYLDCLFLLGEYHLSKREYREALKRIRTIYLHERNARFPRHYLDAVVAYLKDLYLRKLPQALPPEEALYFIREAQELDLGKRDRSFLERVEEQLRQKASSPSRPARNGHASGHGGHAAGAR
jgi:curved DNA-binding protein CbpA